MKPTKTVTQSNGICRSGCKTQNHNSYSECLKASNVGIATGETSKGRFSTL